MTIYLYKRLESISLKFTNLKFLDQFLHRRSEKKKASVQSGYINHTL